MWEFPERNELERLLRSLSPSGLELVQRILEGRTVWSPQSRPQWMALLSPAFELLYGGAAGGGKSDLLLGMARLCHRSALLLRRTYPELEDSLILRSKQFYGDPRLYNGGMHVWQLAPQSGTGAGQRIRFGHLEHEDDVHRYQSAQFDYIGFDELTQFTKLQYEYMLSRARTVETGQRVRVVGCTNPGNEGNDWVMERWAPWLDEGYPRPAQPGEVRWFRREPDGREVETTEGDPDGTSRTFIPARLEDNPYLGDDYRRQLQMLPEPYRSQLLRGDWRAGQVESAYQVIPTAWIRAAMGRWREERSGLAGTATQVRTTSVLTCVGVDVARGGDDQTVLARRYGTWFAPLEKCAGRTTPDGQSVAGLIARALADGGYANVDVIGIGASAYDVARMQGLRVQPVNFAEGSQATDRSGTLRFANVRAEAYWTLRDALDPENGQGLALPNDPELLGDLRAPRWRMSSRGIVIEDKEQIGKRLGRSPDCGDAVALAWLMKVAEKKHGPLPGVAMVGGRRAPQGGTRAVQGSRGAGERS